MNKTLQCSRTKQVILYYTFIVSFTLWDDTVVPLQCFIVPRLRRECLEVRAQVSSCGCCVTVPSVEGWKGVLKRSWSTKGTHSGLMAHRWTWHFSFAACQSVIGRGDCFLTQMVFFWYLKIDCHSYCNVNTDQRLAARSNILRGGELWKPCHGFSNHTLALVTGTTTAITLDFSKL